MSLLTTLLQSAMHATLGANGLRSDTRFSATFWKNMLAGKTLVREKEKDGMQDALDVILFDAGEKSIVRSLRRCRVLHISAVTVLGCDEVQSLVPVGVRRRLEEVIRVWPPRCTRLVCARLRTCLSEEKREVSDARKLKQMNEVCLYSGVLQLSYSTSVGM